jgi:hypothetical protein
MKKNTSGRPPHKEKSKTFRIDLKPSIVEKVGGWKKIKDHILLFIKENQQKES